MVMLCSCAKRLVYYNLRQGPIRVIDGLSTKLCTKDCDQFSNMQDLHIKFKDFVVFFIQDALLGLCHSHFTYLKRVTLIMIIYCNYSEFEDYLAKI